MPLRFFITIILLVIVLLMQSCIRTENKSNNDTELLNKIDSLRSELKELKTLRQKDSVITDTIIKLVQPIITPKTLSTKKDTIK